MKRFFTYLMILALLLSLAACGGQGSGGETTGAAPPVSAAEPADALSALRTDMKPPVIAAAVLGFPELREGFGIMDFLTDEYPGWMERQDFIRNMPRERIVYTASGEDAWAEWICIVPLDPKATVCVNVTRYTEDYAESEETVAYRSETGDPILLQVDVSEYASVTVVVTDSEGRGVIWTPYWDDAAPIPEDGYTGALVMDFSPLSEKTPYEIYQTQGWRIPELAELTDTFWLSWNGYALELGEHCGSAVFYDVGEIGEYIRSHTGSWQYADGLLHLSLVPDSGDGRPVEDSFPLLVLDGQLWLGRNDGGSALPHFRPDMLCDILEQPKG